ncbi:hypothetical protein D3H65_30505 [Paraflavitalea soli]|uniref:Uncharacterized protein n=1 Tax=Paraflavitalea soli TaxID=2315862 RepID=A0A3B7MU61_9BACT|nr:hypothetical protein [Paraflavitalea soli]AXY78062.1 hypothetical protein D3H65_30505 [Paraflavitalea soli]
MKVIYTTILGSLLLLCTQFASAQESDTAIATRNALKYADSIVKANFYQDWKTFMDLSCPTAIKYYGGPVQFKERVVLIYFRNEPKLEEKPETIRILEMRNEINEWQCVVEKVRNTFINDKKAIITSYLIGQSLDAGETWKFIDVSHNSMESVAYLLPGIFDKLTIPLSTTVYPGEVVAAPEEVAPPAKTTAKKRSAAKGK